MTIKPSEAIDSRTPGTAPAALPLMLPERDVRRKRPLAVSHVLRLETTLRVARIISLLIFDYIGLVGALFTAFLIKLVITNGELSASAAWGNIKDETAFAYLLVVLLFARLDLYGERSRRPGVTKIATGLFQAEVIALVFSLAKGVHFKSYYIFYGSLFFAIVYIAALRELHFRATAWLLERAGYRERALLVGSGKQVDDVAQALAGHTRTLVDIVGYVSSDPEPSSGLRSFGGLEQLPEVLANERLHEIIIADPDFPQEEAIELVDMCHQLGVTVHIAPSTMDILIDRAEFVPGQRVPLFTLRPPVFEGLDYAFKRSFDLIVSSISLIILSPLLLAIALAVKLSSRGPVIYRSARPGMAGKPFDCLKFRTMRIQSEEIQAQLEPLNEMSGALFKIRDDPRLTPVGRLLRRFSLDELPQLFNVIRGEMSLVGPRPLPMRDFERLEDWHKKRYLVLPGITGLWQVSGRAELDFDDLVRLDFVYLESWSIMLDLVILVKTIPAVFSRRGAF